MQAMVSAIPVHVELANARAKIVTNLAIGTVHLAQSVPEATGAIAPRNASSEQQSVDHAFVTITTEAKTVTCDANSEPTIPSAAAMECAATVHLVPGAAYARAHTKGPRATAPRTIV